MFIGFRNGIQKHLTSILSIVTAISVKLRHLLRRLSNGIRIEIFVTEGGINDDKESDRLAKHEDC